MTSLPLSNIRESKIKTHKSILILSLLRIRILGRGVIYYATILCDHDTAFDLHDLGPVQGIVVIQEIFEDSQYERDDRHTGGYTAVGL